MKRIVLLLLCFMGCVYANAQNYIVVSKKDFQLSVLNQKGDTLCSLPCALGANLGDKQMEGDKKTPEGKFHVSEIKNSRKWKHDFGDGAGLRKGAYGPWFFRLEVPNAEGIGIHGTCFPESIGTRCTEGCIRLKNSDLEKLRHYVFIGMIVVIEADIL